MKKILLSLFLMIAALLTASSVFAYPTLDDSEDYSDKKIVFLGDSITAGTHVTYPEKRYSNIVADELGFGAFNVLGVSGSTIAIRDGRTDSLAERALADVPADADYVVVFGGVNDWTNNVAHATVGTSMDTLISNLESKTDSVIIVMTPFKSQNGETPYTTANTAGSTLTQIVSVIKGKTDESGDSTPRVNLINLFDIIGFDATDAEDHDEYTVDGIHLNVKGHRRVADILISFFKGDNLLETNNVQWTDGGYVSSGAITTNSGFAYSNLIPVEEGKTYVYYLTVTGSPFGVYGQFHDEDEVYVSVIPHSPSHLYEVFTVPAGVKYIALNSGVSQMHKDQNFLRLIKNFEEFTVSFDSNGGSAVAQQVLEVDDEITKPTNPTRTGYTFAGWYEDEDLTTLYDFDEQLALTGDVTLYAKWLVNSTGGGLIDNSTVSQWSIIILGLAVVGLAVFAFTPKKKR